MSAVTQSDHVILGLLRGFEHGTSILVTDLMQDEDRMTWSCEVLSNVTQWFRRRCILKKLMTTHIRWQTDIGNNPITKAL